jgi:hypothetical protein
MIEEVTVQSLHEYIRWHPQTDYLGNHRLSNEKFQNLIGFSKTRCLKEGIRQSWNEINSNKSGFNPLKYLEEAKEKDIDLTKFFPKD